MNKNIIRILSLAALLAAFACEPKENIPSMEDYDLISVSSGADLAFKAIGGDGVITISPIDEKLEAVSQQSWCHITSVEGNKISVHVDEYGGLESRYAKIVLKAGEAEAVTVVQQYGIIVRTFETRRTSPSRTTPRMSPSPTRPMKRSSTPSATPTGRPSSSSPKSCASRWPRTLPRNTARLRSTGISVK